MSRVNSSTTTSLNTTNLQTPSHSQSVNAPPVAEQIQQTLFGRVMPRQVRIEDFPDLAAILKYLNSCRKKLAQLQGDRDDDYRIVLSDDTIACIDKDGTIFMGVGFLLAFLKQPAVLVGALAHEIGHQPKRWKSPRFQMRKELTRDDINGICREEETRADICCGRGLAELGLECEPIIEFLKQVQVKPHPEYFAAEVRAEVIREAHGNRDYRVQQRKKLFPGYNRNASVRGYIGRG